jgi:hypothetical protein
MKETTTFYRHALLSKEEDIHVLVLQNLETVVFFKMEILMYHTFITLP